MSMAEKTQESEQNATKRSRHCQDCRRWLDETGSTVPMYRLPSIVYCVVVAMLFWLLDRDLYLRQVRIRRSLNRQILRLFPPENRKNCSNLCVIFN